MSNILYYSKKCEHSKSMIIHISQSPAKESVQFLCVDELIKNGTLPSFIKSVPVIFKRDTNSLLKGDAAMAWIRSFNPPESEGDIGGFDSFSSSYSGLSEEGYGGAFSTGDMYSFIEGADNSGSQGQQGQQGQQGSDQSKSSMKSQKQAVMDSAYDKMMADRQEIGQGMKRT